MHRCCRQADGYEVVAVVGKRGPLAARLRADGLTPHQLSPRLRALPLLAAWQLARLIDRSGIDLIHCHWGKDLPLAALAKRLARRRPVLVYTRQMQITRQKSDPYHRFVWRQVDRVLAITEQLATDLRRLVPNLSPTAVETLYLGVPAVTPLLPAERAALRAELGAGEGELLVGLFGRIKRYKGQHLLMEAMAEFVASEAPVRALIVGRAMEPAYLTALQDEAAQLGGRVVLRDFVEAPQRLMQACDVVVLTTREETFGLVLAEAMRAGVAVVGSDRGGVPEIIDHGRTGLLFRSGSASGLHAALQQLLVEPALRTQLAAAGQAAADRRFDETEHFARLASTLLAVCRPG